MKNADAEGEATADYWNQGHGRGSLDLKAKVAHLKVTRIVRYLPTSISESCASISVMRCRPARRAAATIEVHGDLTKFPYRAVSRCRHLPHRGAVQGRQVRSRRRSRRARWRTASPNFWPALRGHRRHVPAGAEQAALRHRPRALSQRRDHEDERPASRTLGNRESLLLINGHAHGPLADMLEYVDDSSLGLISKHAARRSTRRRRDARAQARHSAHPAPKPHVDYDGSLGFADNEIAY